MTPSGKGTLAVWVAAALVLGALDVFLVLWTPGEGDYKSPWAVPAVTFFLFVVLYAMLTELMRRRLVVEMRGADAPPRAPDERTNADDRLPPPPLRVEVSTTREILGTSRHEPPEAARARQVFDHSVAVHRNQVYLLVTANVLMASIAMLLQQPYPLFGTPAIILIGAPLALSFLGMLGRRTSRLTIQYVAWLALHVAWVVATCVVAGSYLVTALADLPPPGETRGSAIALATMCVLAMLFYFRRVLAAQQRLRREVLAAPPIRLLFLWVFGDGQRINSLLSGIGAVWRCLGPLQFLQGGGMIGMGGDVFRHFRGHSLIADSDQDVDARIAAFTWAPDPWWCMYATNTLLCGDRSWRHALERLLDTDIVLMDLSGFSSVNAGCVYEIGQIVNRIVTSRFVFLVDASTDMDALGATLELAWARMDAASPNRRPDCDAIRLFRCDREVDAKGHPLAGHMKRNADCLVDLLCAGVGDSLKNARPSHEQRLH